jgi:hypothetical protein
MFSPPGKIVPFQQLPHLCPLTPVHFSDCSQVVWQLKDILPHRSIEGTTITVVNGMQGLPQANLSGVEIYGANDTSRFLGWQCKRSFLPFPCSFF